MKITDLEDLGLSITEQDLPAFEAIIGAKLPNDYRAFLLKTNGGRVRDDNGYFYLEECDLLIRANFFYGLHRPDVDLYELASVLESMRQNYPEAFAGSHKLPIAADVFGNKFYISLKGSDYGSVYYWMHGSDGADDDFLNDSFSGFFNSLSQRKE